MSRDRFDLGFFVYSAYLSFNSDIGFNIITGLVVLVISMSSFLIRRKGNVRLYEIGGMIAFVSVAIFFYTHRQPDQMFVTAVACIGWLLGGILFISVGSHGQA